MDQTNLRSQATQELSHVTFYPAHAARRIGTMVEGRPDWCISRQRNWGVPIPAFTCKDCGELVLNDATLDKTIELFKNCGSDAWFTQDPQDYLGDACVCPACESHNLQANKDILDVWWDSGVSHTAVCKHRPELQFPADMYLEGSDQHRGWFMSSLMTSVGAYGMAPYKSVVSQGFTLDGQGRKMSKSLGNVIDPNKVCATQGADIIRLWVASVDTSVDVSCDEEILSHVGNAYRHFRNTFRFLLGELEDQFDLATDGLAFDDLCDYDKCVLTRMCEVHNQVTQAYQDYKFNQVYRTLYDYVVTELSQGYLNATKDRVYCGATTGLERRSALTTWSYLLAMLVRDLQPILVFTCDEVLEHMPQSLREGKSFAALLSWFSAPVDVKHMATYLPAYKALVQIRNSFTKAYERAREDTSFEENTTQATLARISLTLDMKKALEVVPHLDIAEALVCSAVELSDGKDLSCSVVQATGAKCPRCWNWRHLESDGLCSRCSKVMGNL